ncbi:MAG: alpha-1,4-glucan--maltose-1-phosphate maltosyltransferase, partial [Nevskia sp.]|nr:alpha-1,4-glucan--maltose-1-phosphate maltosyltransferase [Nevskia sp.]
PPRLQALQQALIGDLAERAQFIDWQPASSLRAGLAPSHQAVTLLALLDAPSDQDASGKQPIGDAMLECACCQVRALTAGSTHGVMLPMAYGRAALDAEGHLRPTSRLTEALQTPAAETAPQASSPKTAKVELAVRASLRARRAQIKATIDEALAARRIVIANLDPSIDNGRYPAKRVVGDSVVVEADVFTDGHDQLAVNLLWRPLGATTWNRAVMHPLGNDRFRGRFTLPALGRHQFTVEAWRDVWASFRSELRKKHGAGLRVAVEIDEGRHLIEAAAARTKKPLAEPLRKLIERLATASERDRIELLLDLDTAAAMAAADDHPFATLLEPGAEVDAERSAAAFSAWYEIFPRSMSGDSRRHGNFDDVIAALPRIRDMGFDVLYMPPIHPIGTTNRKGRNNTLTPAPDDPGSPYAIGSAEGGHDAIHPQLGTLEDFRRMRDAAAAHGLELALDFAIQCSPDHPWLKDHPEWFAWRADGSIKYAENPPKKYEDIVNVDFYAQKTQGAKPGLWQALRDVLLFWVNEGVNIFRVDNPHTKPLPFWEWLIADVRGQHPQVIFLAEAFTRPGPMLELAKIGFSQSYTYFTWRNSKAELTEYLSELNTPPLRDCFRPHFFVNTPDINPLFLQTSGRAGHLIRAALAATLSGLWGVYSGFELCEARAIPGKEEYLDSEKYQLKAWDWLRPGHITQEITALNRIRRENPALHTQHGLEFHTALNDQILYFEKATENRDNVLLIAINLDPHHPQTASFEVPLWRWQLPDDAELEACDLLDGSRFVWRGKTQTLRLDPAKPYAIWRVRPVHTRQQGA